MWISRKSGGSNEIINKSNNNLAYQLIGSRIQNLFAAAHNYFWQSM